MIGHDIEIQRVTLTRMRDRLPTGPARMFAEGALRMLNFLADPQRNQSPQALLTFLCQGVEGLKMEGEQFSIEAPKPKYVDEGQRTT